VESGSRLVTNGIHKQVINALLGMVRTMVRQDFYVNGEARTEDVTLAWKAACKMLAESEAAELWLVGPDMNRLKHKSDIVIAIGEKSAKLFLQGGHINEKGRIIRYYTERTFPKMGGNAIVLLIDPSHSLMTKADEMLDYVALIVVPWCFKDVQMWINEHKPMDILQYMSS